MIFGARPDTRGRIMDEHRMAARHRRHGIIGVLVIVVALAVTGMAYLNPTGRSGYTAHLPSAAGVRSGDEVRIAGIPVGKVTSIRLAGTVVEMKFTVQRSVFVGAQSALEVKLLTPLGGHYLALAPRGDLPLGATVIPPQRVTTPFEINDLIQAVTPIVKEVDGQVIHDTFTEVANAAGRYPDALRDVLQTADALTAALSQVSTEFHKALDFGNDSLRAMVAGRRQLVELAEQFALVGLRYTSKTVDIVEFFALLSELARIGDRLMVFYEREVAPTVNGIDDIFDTLFAHPERLGRAAEGLGQILDIVAPMLSGNGVVFDQSNRLIPGQDLCVPNITRAC